MVQCSKFDLLFSRTRNVLSLLYFKINVYMNTVNTMQGSISAKHWFLCAAVMSAIIICANTFNNQTVILIKIIVSYTCNDIWSRILYKRYYDQRIPCLQRCLVHFYVLHYCSEEGSGEGPFGQTPYYSTASKITELKQRNKCNCRINTCKPAMYVSHDLTLTDKTYCTASYYI